MTPCKLWTGRLNKDGYGTRGDRLAHRIAWADENGVIPRGLSVLHRCDVRNCINLDHLFIGTQQDNIADMIAKGRAGLFRNKRGVNNPKAKLNGDDVWAIRWAMRLKLFTIREISRSYGLSFGSIWRIKVGETWPHITPNWPFDDKGTWQ